MCGEILGHEGRFCSEGCEHDYYYQNRTCETCGGEFWDGCTSCTCENWDDKEEENAWINVEEKQPELLDVVLCIDEFGYMQVAGFSDYWYNKINGEKLENGKITHWMHLPEPPTQIGA